MTGASGEERRQAATERARALVAEAMDLLDAHGGSRPAAAHLALALDELRSSGAPTDQSGSNPPE